MPRYISANKFYETRLKADMVAMLKELKTEIEENAPVDDLNALSTKATCMAIVQQKIDALKEENHER